MEYVHVFLLYSSLPVLGFNILLSIFAIDSVERGKVVDTDFPVMCSIYNIILSVSGIIAVISGSGSVMDDFHTLLSQVIWFMLLVISLAKMLKYPFEPNSNIPLIERASKHLRAKAAYQILIQTAYFTLIYLIGTLCTILFISSFLISVREWPMFFKTIFQVCFFLGGLIMPSFSIIFAMQELEFPSAPSPRIDVTPTAVQSPVVKSHQMEVNSTVKIEKEKVDITQRKEDFASEDSEQRKLQPNGTDAV